ncbi:hypothetical protein [Cnuella takakiae]|nr:hypothetical protein [Cnuella takakiae]OLY93668.1 hypothetical protein BUE76_18615 [Cnuella takakiae]
MNIQSFKSLNCKQKRRALLRSGQFIADRNTDLFSVFLFRLGDFFVELFFSRENEQVVGIRPIQKLSRQYLHLAA